MKNIALIAHDRMKNDMLGFVKQHHDLLSAYKVLATATTGKMIKEHTSLNVTTYLSGPLGGDQQIGARIALGEIFFVIFLRDPLTAQPHEPDITALLRICDVHNIPVATNLATAEYFMHMLKE